MIDSVALFFDLEDAMKIVIPMAGNGKRFNDYLSPKPLIDIEGKAMIEHAISFLPKEYEFIFLCHQDHLKNTNIREVINSLVPNYKIISIPPNTKGPGETCSFAFNDIKNDDEILVSYCDTIQVVNFNHFLTKIEEVKPDGALFSFKGLHPASMGETYYAYLKVDENNYITQIREKQSFTNNRLNEYASSGIYYFASGEMFKKYVNDLIQDPKNSVNGEFYMSLPFNLMIKDGKKVLNYPIEKFISLGIPRDYELYKFWSELFLEMNFSHLSFDNVNLNVTNIFPLAGGERDFIDMGFQDLNFMVPIMNKPVIYHAFRSNPKGVKNIFIGLKDHAHIFKSVPLFNKPNSEVVLLDQKKESLILTLHAIKNKVSPSEAICITGATHIMDFNDRMMNSLMEKKDIDVILFSFTHNECVLRNPNGFAYAKLKNNIEVDEIREKETISDNPYYDHALTGTAIFRRSEDLFNAIEREFDKPKEERSNYYLSCLNNIPEKKIVVFTVDKFVSLRTPANFMEFAYWEHYFNNLEHHPYSKKYF